MRNAPARDHNQYCIGSRTAAVLKEISHDESLEETEGFWQGFNLVVQAVDNYVSLSQREDTSCSWYDYILQHHYSNNIFQ